MFRMFPHLNKLCDAVGFIQTSLTVPTTFSFKTHSGPFVSSGFYVVEFKLKQKLCGARSSPLQPKHILSQCTLHSAAFFSLCQEHPRTHLNRLYMFFRAQRGTVQHLFPFHPHPLLCREESASWGTETAADRLITPSKNLYRITSRTEKELILCSFRKTSDQPIASYQDQI